MAVQGGDRLCLLIISFSILTIPYSSSASPTTINPRNFLSVLTNGQEVRVTETLPPDNRNNDGASSVKTSRKSVSYRPTSAEWSYAEQDKWPLTFPMCGGTSQSPINIVPNINGALILNFISSDQTISEVEVVNDGFTLEAKYVGGSRPSITGSAANGDVFLFDEIHFHWGSSDNSGSEHAILGNKFPVEMHIVHFNQKYDSVEGALSRQDGLMVVAVFFQVAAEDNPQLNPLFDQISRVRCAGQSVILNDFLTVASFLPVNRNDFYRYQGSLTTPPCSESVTWIILRSPLDMGRRQINRLRDLRDANCRATISNNWRNLQDTNERQIFQSH